MNDIDVTDKIIEFGGLLAIKDSGGVPIARYNRATQHVQMFDKSYRFEMKDGLPKIFKIATEPTLEERARTAGL